MPEVRRPILMPRTRGSKRCPVCGEWFHAGWGNWKRHYEACVRARNERNRKRAEKWDKILKEQRETKEAK